MHPNFPVYEMVKNGKLPVESAEKLNPAKWKYTQRTKQHEVGRTVFRRERRENVLTILCSFCLHL